MMTFRRNPDDNVSPIREKKEGPSRVRSLTSMLKLHHRGSRRPAPQEDLKDKQQMKRAEDSKLRLSSSSDSDPNSTTSIVTSITNKQNKRNSHSRKSLGGGSDHGAPPRLPPSTRSASRRRNRNNGRLSNSLSSSTNSSSSNNNNKSNNNGVPRSKSFTGLTNKLREQFMLDDVSTTNMRRNSQRRGSSVNRSINSREAIALARRSTASSKRQMARKKN